MPRGSSDRNRSAPRSAADLLVCVLHALPFGVGLFEVDGDRIVFLAGNPEFTRVLRLTRPPEEGQSLSDVFTRAEGDAVQGLFERVRDRAEPQSVFAPVTLGPEPQRIWNIDAYPVFTGRRVTHIMALAQQSQEKLDVRQRQQHEADRLREKADQLAELEKAKSEFLRMASHELRGPATMLGGYLSLMEDESLGPIPKRMRPVLPLLRAKAAQINLLANEMVEAARLDDQRLQLQRRRLELREVVRRCLQAARASATPKHRLRFEDRVHHKVPMMADPMRLDIIIGNLIDNAIKYSPGGGDVTVQLSIA